MAPLSPERERISSRSPIDFMAAAVSTSPAVELNTTAAIMAVAAHTPVAPFMPRSSHTGSSNCSRRPLRARRPVRHKAYAQRDERNARPALG